MTKLKPLFAQQATFPPDLTRTGTGILSNGLTITKFLLTDLFCYVGKWLVRDNAALHNFDFLGSLRQFRGEFREALRCQFL